MRRRRRLFFLLLLPALLLTACGVRSEETASGSGMLLYYRSAGQTYGPDSLIAPEETERIDGAEELAARYFSGPRTETLTAPFPKGTALTAFRQEGERLSLTISQEFASLNSADLTLAAACITKTFLQLDGVGEVELSAEDAFLNGSRSICLREDQLLLRDDSTDSAEDLFSIYYPDMQLRYLLAAPVRIPSDTLEKQAEYAIGQLRNVPEEAGMQSVFPQNAELLNLSVEGDVCLLDFSGDFYRNRPTSEKGERMLILSIVNTLTNFEGIRAVRFLIEGAEPGIYYRMDLGLEYVREEQAIGPVKTGLNETDASVYVIRACDGQLVELPIRLRPSANETVADALVGALLSFGDRNGYYAPIPPETSVLSLEESGIRCVLNLSRSFAEGLLTEAEEKNAIYSFAASLKSLSGIYNVSFQIEGESSGLRFYDLTHFY